MDVAQKAPPGKFQIFLIDGERDNRYPGEIFDSSEVALRSARELNSGRTKHDEVHHVFDDEGNNLSFV